MEGCSFVVFANTASTLRTLTLKDHLESKKYGAKKEVRKARNSSSNASSTSQQMALGMAVKSRDSGVLRTGSSTESKEFTDISMECCGVMDGLITF